jgi:hypothetical protein
MKLARAGVTWLQPANLPQRQATHDGDDATPLDTAPLREDAVLRCAER